ncbi:hypothetical protein F1737_04030 [Methanoplanus sp. FWC-SCC4]|uniref:Uncharacterized protein n=2 Tax=Methanochimaera problematica TaxID=2609417 RepID=A0AA97FDA4_9EURY|nr:hypothetical protein F1737_04030 [Methanoplanus sp. FWC-SCC4]
MTSWFNGQIWNADYKKEAKEDNRSYLHQSDIEEILGALTSLFSKIPIISRQFDLAVVLTKPAMKLEIIKLPEFKDRICMRKIILVFKMPLKIYFLHLRSPYSKKEKGVFKLGYLI